MVKEPLVSIIIPAYNEESRISRCLDSLLKQSYSNLEMFVVDDGSTDSTPSIVRSFSKKHKNIFLLQQKQQGPGAAKNLASKKANGSIFVFCDSDEYPLPDYVEKLTAPIRSGESKTSVGAWKFANPQSPWARCRFKDTYAPRRHAVNSGVFRAVDASFFKKTGGFDPSKGYSDDRIDTSESRSRVEDAYFLHDVDSTVSELYSKRKWIGSSMIGNPKGRSFKVKSVLLSLGVIFGAIVLLNWPRFLWLLLLVALLPVVWKSFSKVFFYRDIKLLVYYPLYLVVCIVAMVHGVFAGFYNGRDQKI